MLVKSPKNVADTDVSGAISTRVNSHQLPPADAASMVVMTSATSKLPNASARKTPMRTGAALPPAPAGGSHTPTAACGVPNAAAPGGAAFAYSAGDECMVDAGTFCLGRKGGSAATL